MDYHAKQQAKVNVAFGLMDDGWTIYGFKNDESDSMTDYYNPAHWDGIAERDGFVLVVDNYGYGIGGVTKLRWVIDGECSRCHGSGHDPAGWTFQQAQHNPREYHKHYAALEAIPHAIALMPDVISPVQFKGDREKCHGCHGTGTQGHSEHYLEPWPTFQGNKKGVSWHLEKDGQILDKSVGLKQFVGYQFRDEDRDRIQLAVDKLLGRLHQVMHRESVNA